MLLHGRESFHSTIIGGTITLANPQIQQFLTHSPLAALAQLDFAQSAIISYADVNYAIALLSFVCIPLIFLIRRPKKSGAPVHVEIDAG